MEKVWASLLLCAVALTFVPVGLAQDYTLQNLYREAVKNSEKIKYAEEGSFENLRQTALNDRTDLRSYDMQIQVADRQVKYARGAFWPYVGFFAITTARIKAPRRRPSFGKACWPVPP